METVSGWIPRWRGRYNGVNRSEIILKGETNKDVSIVSAPAKISTAKIHRTRNTHEADRLNLNEKSDSSSESDVEVIRPRVVYGRNRQRSLHHSTPKMGSDHTYARGEGFMLRTRSSSYESDSTQNTNGKNRRKARKSRNQTPPVQARKTDKRDSHTWRNAPGEESSDDDRSFRQAQGSTRQSRVARKIEPKRFSDKKKYKVDSEQYSEDSDSPTYYRRSPARHPQSRKIKDPKPFDGNKIEWSDYLKHFEAVSEWNEWTPSQKAKQLVMSFEGEAIKLLGELSNEILHDFDRLVFELNRRYDPTERAQAWKIEFRSRTRKPNEAIIQYAQELKRIAMKAFPNMSSDAQQQWVLDQFGLGLGNIDLQRHVQFGHPKELNDAISLAIEYEAFEAGTKDRFRKPVNKTETCSVLEKVCQAPANQNQQNSGTNQAANTSHVRENSKEVECFYCKKKGHIIRDCHKLKQKQEREQYGQSRNYYQSSANNYNAYPAPNSYPLPAYPISTVPLTNVQTPNQGN